MGTELQQIVLILLMLEVSKAEEPILSECCERINDSCLKTNRECIDFVKPPFLLLTCRCRMSIRQEHERYKQQCLRDATEFFMEQLKIEESRTIIHELPGHSGPFRGKVAIAGARGPKNRGVVNLSEKFLAEKKKKYLEEQQAKESAMTGGDDVTTDANNIDYREKRDGIADENGPEISLNSEEILIDRINYV